MNFRPSPLLYGAGENFFSSFKLVITMSSLVDYETLSCSVAEAMLRYPYFSVRPERKGNSLVLRFNPYPIPVFGDDRCAVLGSDESSGHLLTFGCEGRKIILNASHCIADGMGIMPLLQTVLYIYVSKLFGTEGLGVEKINMPCEPMMKEEYEYPFADGFVKVDCVLPPKKVPENVYSPCFDVCDTDTFCSYHLHIPQKAIMTIANSSDGSPVSFLSVMLSRALWSLDDRMEQPIVAHVQHQYRSLLNANKSRHSLVSYIPVVLPAQMRSWDIERQNTAVRGQIIIGSEPEAEARAVNRLLAVFSDDERVEFEEKKRAMRKFIDKSIFGKTFGVSYVGKIDWCGLERYVEDVHVYLGEKKTRSMLLVEIMTIGEDFSVSFMQKGSTDRFVNAFVEQLKSFDIPARIIGKENYTVCDTKIPE